MAEETMEQGAPDAGTDGGAERVMERASEGPEAERPEGEAAGADGGEQSPQEPDGDPDDAPIRDWSGVKLDLPEDADVDEAVLGSFGKAAVELGLTPRQAKALANWQLDAVARGRERLMEAGAEELSKEWGGKAADNQKAVLSLISRIDRMTGGDGFSRALGQSGATCFPGVVRGLLAVAGLLSEDGMGKGGAAGQAEHEETALEGLNNALKEARRGKK